MNTKRAYELLKDRRAMTLLNDLNLRAQLVSEPDKVHALIPRVRHGLIGYMSYLRDIGSSEATFDELRSEHPREYKSLIECVILAVNELKLTI